ncbi:hypothetical protein CRG98_022374 [Punica granatum]|uniref:Uncharacterized protein n=1 Tax=Punica granatum TaxID=22663 RepID=A0A2I0JLS7_PUNGR|nr:hypothetical protein CRG98_022374 [Punica granatum]
MGDPSSVMARLAEVVGRNGVRRGPVVFRWFWPVSALRWFGRKQGRGLGACVGPFSGAVYLSVGRAPGSPVRKGVCESSGVSRLKQDVSEMRPDVSLVTLALRGIFRVPHWAPFEASVIQ